MQINDIIEDFSDQLSPNYKSNHLPKALEYHRRLMMIQRLTHHMRSTKYCKGCDLSSMFGHEETYIVPGTGNVLTDMMIIGRAPERYENEFEFPLIGPAGIILTIILSAAGIDRNNTWITSIIKCQIRNQDPAHSQVTQCIRFLKKEINIIRPKVILTLGYAALKAFFPEVKSITKERGKVRKCIFKDHDDQFEVNIVPTFHPMYLLYKVDTDLQIAKKSVFDDVRLALSLRSDNIAINIP